MEDISRIEGIGEDYSYKLRQMGIRTVESLLEKTCTVKGRRALAREMGIPETTVLKWANQADLHRIKGIGKEYGELLEAAGVDTVVELSRRKPDNLYFKILEVNARKRLVRRTPPQNAVRRWVESAQKMSRTIIYH